MWNFRSEYAHSFIGLDFQSNALYWFIFQLEKEHRSCCEKVLSVSFVSTSAGQSNLKSFKLLFHIQIRFVPDWKNNTNQTYIVSRVTGVSRRYEGPIGDTPLKPLVHHITIVLSGVWGLIKILGQPVRVFQVKDWLCKPSDEIHFASTIKHFYISNLRLSKLPLHSVNSENISKIPLNGS